MSYSLSNMITVHTVNRYNSLELRAIKEYNIGSLPDLNKYIIRHIVSK